MNTLIVARKDNYLIFLKQPPKQENAEVASNWIRDSDSDVVCSEKIGLMCKGHNLLKSHISPDGCHVMNCNGGLEFYQFQR